jgi:hypothetical protein
MSKRKSSSSGTGASDPSMNILKTISRVPSSRALKVGRSSEVKPVGVGPKVGTTALRFGAPSSRGNAGASSIKGKSSWTGLLGSIGGSGVADLLGGNVLSSGLDYLVGGFETLFGGDTTSPEPLTTFELPDTQDERIAVNNVQATPVPTKAPGLYSGSQVVENQISRAAIVKTVRNALLTSSSLNDVIGEL